MQPNRMNEKANNRPPTYFASPERDSAEDISASIARITNSPVLDATVGLLSGWVAILNEHRQILAINDTLLKALGIAKPADAVGLRPGEALECAHAHDHPGGCGTSKFCATCGLAIAAVTTQKTDQPQERMCVLSTQSDGVTFDRIFAVRSSPLTWEGEKFVAVCMKDVSAEQRRIALERTFLHDLSNLLTSLAGSAHLLDRDTVITQPEFVQRIRETTDVLIREVDIQRLLCQDSIQEIKVGVDEVTPRLVLERINTVFADHPAAQGQSLKIQVPTEDITLKTDLGLLIRVLVNMVVNALETGEPGDEVCINTETCDGEVAFRVWNRHPIPDDVSMRVFQKYFSTKPGGGRGIGTFAMKLLGESLLRGNVTFNSSQTYGTTFQISLPYNCQKQR